MRYDFFHTGQIGVLTLVADDQGLRHIDFENDRTPVRVQPDWHRDPSFFAAARDQLTAYFQGTLKRFDLPLAPVGTPFQQAVWQTLQTIPYGALVSYRWVSERVGNPKASRAVGGATGKNPLPIIIPCHRVVGSNGALTGFGGGLAVKERLIELETKGRPPKAALNRLLSSAHP